MVAREVAMEAPIKKRLNSRKKGQRTFAKAIRYALSFPGTVAIPLYQVSRWAAPQPFDVLLLRPTYWPRFVEVRTTAWGVSKPQTRTLAALPGESYHKQIWLFERGTQTPRLREWQEIAWKPINHPWED